ncbi:MAG: type II secretion system protein GspJ [Nitrospinota bacterium]
MPLHIIKNRDGFTIIEILLALSIMAIVVSIMFSLYYASTGIIEEGRSKSDIYQTARLSLDRMSNEISSTFYSENSGSEDILSTPDEKPERIIFIGEDIQDGEYSLDRLNFISAIYRWIRKDAPETELCEIGYYLSQEYKEDGTRVLLRREDATVDDEPLEGGNVLELAESVVGLDFKYYDENGKNKTDSWDSTTTDKGRKIPSAVKITISLKDKKGTVKNFSTLAEIMITVPSAGGGSSPPSEGGSPSPYPFQ